MKNNVKNIAFLFGSGISIPAKIPSTSRITKIILESSEIVLGSAENFYFDDPTKTYWSLYKDVPKRVQLFLNELKNEIQEYYGKKTRAVNYEDIYYLLDFIEFNYYQKEGNPAFKYLLKEFEPKIKKLLTPLDPTLEVSLDMNNILSESKKFIKQTVAKLLSKKAETFDGLKFLSEALSDTEFNSFDVFTLNHDFILEEFFESNKIDYNDGFQKNNESVDIWNPNIFKSDGKIKLYKIHGSVHWQYYDTESWEDNRISKFPISLMEKFDTIANALILIGTHNKMSDYIKDLYLELYYRFYQSLNKHNCLVIIGYGFNDRGINQKIFNWLYNPSNKIILIDPKLDEIRFKFPSYFFGNWDKNQNIKKIPHLIENVNWDSIKKQC